MSRLEVPVQAKVLWTTGDVRLWVDVGLRLRDGGGGWHDEILRVDTATDLTTMPAYDAKQFGLPIPRDAAAGITHTQTGLEIRSRLSSVSDCRPGRHRIRRPLFLPRRPGHAARRAAGQAP